MLTSRQKTCYPSESSSWPVRRAASYHACPVLRPAGLLRRLDNGPCDDLAVGFGDLIFLELARHALLDQAMEADGDLGDIGGGDGRLDRVVDVAG